MPLDENGPGFIRRTLRSCKSLTKVNRPAILLIAVVALVSAAIAFSVSVESRSAGWLSKLQPSAPSSSNPEPAKTSSTASASVASHRPLGPNAALLVPTITATKTDSFADADLDGKAEPGETVHYTVNIGAAGEDATGVTFSDMVDPNTNFVAGTLAASAVAVNDTFPVTVTGNVRINSANLTTPFSVVANDFLGVNTTSTISAFDATTANGGQIVMTTSGVDMGKFTYNPPAGFEGVDTFTYTLTDNPNATTAASNRTATVSITVSGMIWFINNNSAACTTLAAGCGRLTNPFSSLSAFNALNNGTGNNPAANDNIFVYESATDYVGPVTLLNGQKFIGQDATASLSAISGITPAVGSDPLPPTTPGAPIVNITSAGIGITVAQNNTLRGFTGGNATTDINGSTIGTLNVSDVTLNGNGQTLNLSTGTLNGSFGSISSTNSATTGLSLTSIGGSLTTGSTTVTNPTGIGLSVNTSSLTLGFADTSVTGSGGTGVSLTTNTGAITFADLDISPDGGQRGLLATDNAQTITATSGTIGTTTGTAVEITRASSTTPLAMVLTSVSSSGAPNGIMLKNTSGSFTVNGDGTNTSVGGNASGGTITNATGADGATSGTGVYADNVQNLTLRRMTINGTNQNFGIRGNSVNNFTLEYTTVNGTNGTAAALAPPEGAGEGAVYFGNTTTTGMTGVGTITNCLISGGRSRNFSLINSSGSLNRLTITGTTFGLVQNFIDAQRVFSVEGRPSVGGTTVNVTVTGSSFAGSPGDVVNFTGQEPSTTTSVNMDVVFQNNAVSNSHALNNISGGGMKIANFRGMTFNVSNNSFRDADGSALTLQLGAPVGGSTIATNLSGTINNNTIGVSGVLNSGSKSGNGIFLSFADNTTAPKGQVTLAITNNTIRQYKGNAGIFADNTAGNYDLNATITGNTTAEPGVNAFAGLALAAGAPASADDIDVCANITGNNFSAGDPTNSNDIILGGGASGASSIRLPGLVPSGTEAQRQTQVQTFVLGNNNVAGTVVTAYVDSPATFATTFIGGAACTTPTTGPITPSSSEVSAESVNTQLRTALDESQSTLLASRGENSDSHNVVKLTESEASAMLQAAIARWADAGLSATNVARLQSVTLEIADLPAGQLATVSSSKITLDETAAGYGWFFDTTPSDDNEFEVPVLNKERQTTEASAAQGRMDLLTVLMRQLGSQISRGKSPLEGAPAWLMEGAIDTGTRRAPAFRTSEIVKVKSAPDAKLAKQVPAKANSQKSEASYQQVASLKTPRNSRVLRNHAMRAAALTAFVDDVNLSIGTLPAGKSVTIKFDVTVDNPYLGATNQVQNQGRVNGTNFGETLTDDPDVVGTANPTVTTIDQPDVTVTVSPASVLEDGSDNLVYTFSREGVTTSPLTVNFSVGGTATFNTDYTQTGAATFNASSGTVTIPAGSATATVTLDPTADSTVELNETAILTVVTGASYDVGTPAAATGTITNDDTDVTVAVAPSSVEEDGAPNLVYTFTRNGVTTGALTVNFSVGGTATFNTDYTQTGAATFTSTDGTVTFGAGNTTATVTVDPTADMVVEPNETVILTLTAGTGYNVANPSTATGTITNDDADVSIAVAPSEVEEDGATNLVYTFTRTGDTTGTLVVNFTISGTADPATDYTQTGATSFTPPNGTVTFAAGNATATVTVDPTADVTAEANETVTFTLAAGSDYNVGAPSVATGTINNDDTTVSVAVSPGAVDEDGATNLVYTFTRSDSSGPLTVNFSIGGTATFNTDYTQTGAATFTPPTGTVTFADGNLTATVTVDPSADITVEPDETVILTVTAGTGYTVGAPASASGTITNDDTDVTVAVSPLSTAEDGATNLVYTFTRTGVTTGALSVNFLVNGTATFNTDYTQTGATTFAPSNGTVDFAAGSSTATVTIDPTADNSVEPDETVTLTVTNGTGYNIGVPSAATGTITNDDSSVTVAVAPSSVDEDGATNLVYTFTRTGSTTGALTVNFSVGGTADSSTDYTQTGAATFTPPTGTVTFAAGSSTATVTIDPSADITTEPDETVILTVTAGTGYEVGVPDSATGTINNDDNSVSVAVSPGAVNEDGATNLVYTFTRGDSTDAQTINFSVGGTATFNTDYTQTGAATFGATGTVEFAAGSLTATVTIDPSADLTVEPDETVVLTVTAGSGYSVGAPSSASGTITNDDTDVTVAVSPLSTAEDGATNLVYTFSRTGVTTGPLTVNFSVGGTATFSTDYTESGAASFTPPTGTVTFVAGSSTATITVDPVADGAAEGDETVILTLTAGTGYNVAAPSSATGTIVNDDTEVSVAVSPSSVLEDGATNMVYTFTRVGITSGALTVNFSVGGTAIFAPPGGDYTQFGADTFTNAGPGTVTFLAGSSTATVTVDPFGDADLEPNETVILTVTAGAGYTVGSPNSATGTILNDDNSPPTIMVGYGQCNAATAGTVNLLVSDVETPAGSLTLSATSSNTAVVPLANIIFGGSGANRTLRVNAVAQSTVAFSDLTITVSDGTFTSSINIRVIVGTNKTEVINIGTTTVGTDMIFGGNGDDTINSGAGNDLICGGNGGGAVNGGLGDDTIDGGNGNDTLRGGDGNDLILGGGGNDTLEGGNDNDILDGGSGTDILRGESGDDTLTGGSGPDSFNGGPGNDTATDFNAGQGDTKDISVEIASLFGPNNWSGVLAYLAPPPRWWVNPWGTLYL
jgi:Ca2+-binding RTX toxin-like protein